MINALKVLDTALKSIIIQSAIAKEITDLGTSVSHAIKEAVSMLEKSATLLLEFQRNVLAKYKIVFFAEAGLGSEELRGMRAPREKMVL